MSNYINNINTYADLTAYNADLNKDFPNVSYIKATDEVKMIQYDPEHIVAVYNVTSTESATTLLYTNSEITYQIIDGVQQQSIQTTYTFDTLGEHIVKYKLKGSHTATRQFQNCSSLTSVTIPNNISLYGYNFYHCSGLTKINLPKTLTTIGYAEFEGCSSLASVVIGDSVTSIATYAFYNCTSLTSITIEATTPPTLANVNAFQNTNANLVIYVPAESVDTYKAASGWSQYASRIQAIPTT